MLLLFFSTDLPIRCYFLKKLSDYFSDMLTCFFALVVVQYGLCLKYAGVAPYFASNRTYRILPWILRSYSFYLNLIFETDSFRYTRNFHFVFRVFRPFQTMKSLSISKQFALSWKHLTSFWKRRIRFMELCFQCCNS